MRSKKCNIEVSDFEKPSKNKPYVVLLGAVESVDSIPNVEKNGKFISVVSSFIQKLEMTDFLKEVNLKKERIYSYFRENMLSRIM